MTFPENRASRRDPIDWQQLLLGECGEGIELIERLARRRFNAGVLADEAVTYVLDHLPENDWQRCAGFKGDSQPKTFLQKVIVNLLEEFSRKRFGRPRPPSWLRRQGELWVKLWKELCLERQLLPALVDRYTRGGLYQGAWIEQVARIIKARIPSCGQAVVELSVEADSDASGVPMDDAGASPIGVDAQTSFRQDLCGYDFELNAEAEILLVLRAVMEESPSTASFDSGTVEMLESRARLSRHKLENLRRALTLTDEELVVLRMVYRDGLSRQAVSRALGLPGHRAGLVIGGALGRIREAIETCELDLSSLLKKI